MSRTSRALAAVALAGAVVAATASPAEATFMGRNEGGSAGPIYTRYDCTGSSWSTCKMAVRYPGQRFYDSTRYAMPGFGHTMCDVRHSWPCITGSSYVYINRVDYRGVTWTTR